jgi:hypothetical protein
MAEALAFGRGLADRIELRRSRLSVSERTVAPASELLSCAVSTNGEKRDAMASA